MAKQKSFDVTIGFFFANVQARSKKEAEEKVMADLGEGILDGNITIKDATVTMKEVKP